MAQVRAEVRPAGVLRGAAAHLLQLRRHEQGAAGQDAGRDDARLRAGRRRAWTRSPASCA
ncbi:MAG: hypothetical protein MZW92_64420 [Comamonadaceae bacterium]|nr:hypothetical protein [Comamonadaceae bacterium]